MRYLSSGRARQARRPSTVAELGRRLSLSTFARRLQHSLKRRTGQNDRVRRVDRLVAALDQADVAGDGAGRFDVVAGDHLHFDAGPPALRRWRPSRRRAADRGWRRSRRRRGCFPAPRGGRASRPRRWACRAAIGVARTRASAWPDWPRRAGAIARPPAASVVHSRTLAVRRQIVRTCVPAATPAHPSTSDDELVAVADHGRHPLAFGREVDLIQRRELQAQLLTYSTPASCSQCSSAPSVELPTVTILPCFLFEIGRRVDGGVEGDPVERLSVARPRCVCRSRPSPCAAIAVVHLTVPEQRAPTCILFCVSVPVLSEQMTVAEPIVSQATSCRTRTVGPRHLPHRQGQRHRHAHRQPFGHRDDDDDDHVDEVVEQLAAGKQRCEQSAVAASVGPVRSSPRTDAANEQGDEDEHRGDVADLADEVGQVRQLLLAAASVPSRWSACA